MPVTTYRTKEPVSTKDEEIVEAVEDIKKSKGIEVFVEEKFIKCFFKTKVHYQIYVPIGDIEYQLIQLPAYNRECTLAFLLGFSN